MTYPALKLLINNEWIGADSRRELLPIHNPATGEWLADLPVALQTDIDAAIDAAHQGFAVWRLWSPLERGRLLSRIAEAIRKEADRLAHILTLEQGKTRAEALGEITATADTFEWMAEQGKRVYGQIVASRFPGMEQLVVHEPAGPVGAFSPWNYPAVLASRKVATALAAGCSIVLKPAEETPGIMVAIAQLCVAAGLPPGVLNLLYGVPDAISRSMIASPKIARLSFTGSVPVGRHLLELASRSMKKITLELGGHSPVIIEADVPLERVAELAAAAKFRNAGQVCHAPTRFIVHERVASQFATLLSRHAAAIHVGNGQDPAVQMGPLINRRRQDAMRNLMTQALDDGAQLLAGGSAPEHLGRGTFWSPTVIANAPADTLAMRDEIFGPIALVAAYDTLEQAIDLANASDFGLAAYAFTRSTESMQRIQNNVRAGSISLNTFAVTPPEMPFSGIKMSGSGVEMGEAGLLEYFDTKAVIRSGAI